MRPEQENELIRTIRFLKQEITELKELVTPIAPRKNRFLTMKEACDMMKCSRWTLHRLVKEGTISNEKKGGKLFFKEYDIVAYMNN